MLWHHWRGLRKNMRYNLSITEKAEEQLDRLVYYLLYNFCNRQAALRLLEGIEMIYERLEYNPFQFPDCNDEYLSKQGYRNAKLSDMKYHVVFKVIGNTVYVSGIFHDLEQYRDKL